MSELDRLVEVSRVARADLEALGELEEGQYAMLRGAFERAGAQRERDLNAAIDNGLTLVPPLLRRVARRILFS
ncbi:hypothetical protein D7D52_34425 [Nocardia yunnanensis]|uniref:Uncharacterized protein n=1 Tax=Nocardia yunnanensis TaxID=2382165 RepID=A0A386ZKY2_9NOCA|nr:hypothetical protein [Nocardia yunnanensis]AYF78078.1 hypothetical protein D7D52_34425 [Nocardia yunnanensis]